MRFQANISPWSHSVTGLKVFISYKTQDLQFANHIRVVLESKGFDVTLFEPTDRPYQKGEAEIRSLLRHSLLEADYMCLINSPEASSSGWIAYEFVQAALILGRVCLVDTTGLGGQHAADRLLEAGQRFANKRGLYVKHTALSYGMSGDKKTETIVTEILNSPEERWYDGSSPVPRDRLDLKRQSLLRKAVRSRVYSDSRFSDQRVEEVIPYLVEPYEVAPLAPSEEKLMEILYEEGRLPVLDRYRAGDVVILHATYRISELPFATIGEVGVFVVVSSGFLRSKAMEVSQGVFTDTRDGERYKTVTVNGRTWLAENLRFASDGSWCYGDDPNNVQQYGRLYTWDGATNACPDGWHLASIREWLVLAETFGGCRSNLDLDPENAARAKKSFKTLVAERESVFNVQLAGFRSYFNDYKYLDVDAYFWSSTERDLRSAHIMFFLGGAMETQHGWAYKIAGHSVRCVLGESVDWKSQP